VVDDEPVARRVLARMLEKKGYAVREASAGSEALEVLEEGGVDMLISDIQMPGMNGIELLATARDRFPDVRRVLVTAYDIDDYLSNVRENDVGNVIPKGKAMYGDDIGEYLSSLLSGDIFGVERYFPSSEIHRLAIHTYEEARSACAAVVEGNKVREPLFVEMAVDELISNAVFHGVLHGVPRSQWSEGYRLADKDAVAVSWACDDTMVGVSVVDHRGRLRKADVLRWLDGPLSEREGGEEHGRGLLLVRRLIDRFVINIEPGRTTECILLQYHQKDAAAGQKPVLIQEL
jgi:CheY-like chemotaxis protein/anti-sigma regulatory factor (Ser/Thr protein kinase)